MAFIRYDEGSEGDNILRIHSLNPKTGDAHAHVYRAVMHEASDLSRLQREMIGVVVSGINGCHY